MAADLAIDHVRFLVADAAPWLHELTGRYGFGLRASGDRSHAVGRDGIHLVVTEDPASAFVDAHGDAVSDIALSTSDAAAAFTEAVRRGARPVAEPSERDGVVTATIGSAGDLVHTFVQRRTGPVRATETDGPAMSTIDHIAICVAAGQLDDTVRYYENVLGLRTIFTEHIEVGAQAMNSKVVRTEAGEVTLTLLEPDTTRQPGQIDDFLKNHGGCGVQHIALRTDDITTTVGALAERGVDFLVAPNSYYDLLPNRLTLRRHTVAGLRDLNILVDADHGGQLFQIFARSTHPRRTFFFEIIERAGALTFGSGNITALYEAVELEYQTL